MCKFKRILFGALVICMGLIGCQQVSKPTVTVAASANTQYVMRKLAVEFEKKTAIHVELVFGSSGRLTSQILEGAPYDVFVSADLSYANEIFHQGFAAGAPLVYAYGQFVLWTNKDSSQLDLANLAGNENFKLAIANPQIAPYGRVAEYYLKSIGLWEELSDNLIYGESIAQVNQFIESGAVSCGITSKTILLQEEFSKKGHWKEIKLPAKILPQAVVSLSSIRDLENQEAFINFMLSPEGQKIFKEFGYYID